MKVLTAKVSGGQLQIPEGILEDGAVVTLLVPEKEGVELSAKEEALLLESITQAERGEVVDGWELLRDLRG